MAVPFRILSLLLCLLAAGPMNLPAWAIARPEDRAGETLSGNLESLSASASQPADSPQQHPGYGYDVVLGVRRFNHLNGLSHACGTDLISQKRGAIVRYYGYDGHGSLRFLGTDAATPTFTDSYDYDAFGKLLAASGLPWYESRSC